jgi:hypothetical protein
MKRRILVLVPLLIMFAPLADAQSCFGEMKPLKPLNCQDAAPICLCDEWGLNCRWIWNCASSGYGATTRRAVEPSEPTRPSGGIDTSVYQTLQPLPRNTTLNMLVEYAMIERLINPPPPPPPVHPTSGGEWRAVKEAKTVYLMNRGRDAGVFENLYKRINKWGRWKIAEEQKDADLVLLFSDADDLFSKPRRLGVFHPETKNELLFVSCERRVTAGYTAGVLVNRLKKRVEAIDKRPVVANMQPATKQPDTPAIPLPMLQGWMAKLDSARKRYSDFEAVTASAEAEKLQLTPAMQQAILESEYGADLAYWLGKRPEECRRIAALSALSPLSAARELGRIEERIVIARQGVQ